MVRKISWNVVYVVRSKNVYVEGFNSCQIMTVMKRPNHFYYQVHVSESSSIPDHCSGYALSDPKDTDYQFICSHNHKECCGQCSRLAVTIEEIEKAIEKTMIGTEDSSKEVKDELVFLTGKAKRDINAWKSHLLRSVNQDKARLDILQVLDDASVIRLGNEVYTTEVQRKPSRLVRQAWHSLACICGNSQGE